MLRMASLAVCVCVCDKCSLARGGFNLDLLCYSFVWLATFRLSWHIFACVDASVRVQVWLWVWLCVSFTTSACYLY